MQMVGGFFEEKQNERIWASDPLEYLKRRVLCMTFPGENVCPSQIISEGLKKQYHPSLA